MSNKENKNSGCLIKVYLLVLFVAGIILGFSYISANRNSASDTQEEMKTVKNNTADERKDILLDNNILTALASNGIEQENFVSQYIKEIKNNDKIFNRYFKEIKLNDGQKPENFEPILKTLARNFKIDLSKTKYKDGSYKYSFYDKTGTYSDIVLH